MPHSEELVYTQAEDGLPLEGAAIRPASREPRPTAVVFVHGLTSKFYGRSMVNLGRELADRGYLFVAGNNRGHDFGFPYRGDPRDLTAQPRIYGGGWELFDESPLDVAAWIGFAVGLGARDVVLYGHSLGALKVGYYQAIRQDPRVVGLIAGSPPMVSAGRVDPELLAQAERLVAEGRGQDLLPWGSTRAGANTLSAQSYVNRARVGLDVYGRHAANPLVGRLHVPIFALFGTEEPSVGGPTELETIKRNAVHSPAVTTRMFDGADHSYAGHEPAIAAAMADWLGAL